MVGHRLGELQHLLLGEGPRRLDDEGRAVLELGLQVPALDRTALDDEVALDAHELGGATVDRHVQLRPDRARDRLTQLGI